MYRRLDASTTRGGSGCPIDPRAWNCEIVTRCKRNVPAIGGFVVLTVIVLPTVRRIARLTRERDKRLLAHGERRVGPRGQLGDRESAIGEKLLAIPSPLVAVASALIAAASDSDHDDQHVIAL